LSIKLLCCSKNPAAGLNDEENLKTGYKEDEKVILMPVSWVKAGTFISDLYSPLVLDGNQTIKGKSKFTPQTLWKCTVQDPEKKFGCKKCWWQSHEGSFSFFTIMTVDRNHRKELMIDELDFDGLSAGMLSPVDAKRKWTTPNEFRILQAGCNALDHGANICMISNCIFSLLAILDTWLGTVKALPRLLVPNPTQQQKAAAPGGMVYDHISLKLQRTELASKREAILKNWIRMAKYFLLFRFCDICQRCCQQAHCQNRPQDMVGQ
jgi:hypothetical protein